MIPNFYKILFASLLSSVTTIAFSQNTHTDTTKTKSDTTRTIKKSSFKIGVDFVNNNVFMGRTDTTITPVITPNFKYTLKSGLYFSGSLDFVTNRKTKKLDGGNVAMGYDFDLTDDLSGGVSFTKLFFSKTSTQVNSAISSTVNANLDYDINDIITPSISVDYNINKQGVNNDINLNLGLSHDFIAEGVFGDKDIVLISPMVVANTGTQNFYDGYIQRKNLKNAKRAAAQTTLLNAYYASLSEFKVLDYEYSVPMEYKTGKIIFHFTPTYAIAENQFKSAAVVKALGLSAQSSVFYFEIGVALKF